MAADGVLRQRHETPEELVPRVRVVSDPAQHVQGYGLDQVEEQVVVVVHARSVARPA